MQEQKPRDRFKRHRFARWALEKFQADPTFSNQMLFSLKRFRSWHFIQKSRWFSVSFELLESSAYFFFKWCRWEAKRQSWPLARLFDAPSLSSWSLRHLLSARRRHLSHITSINWEHTSVCRVVTKIVWYHTGRLFPVNICKV